jgi:hypothetical protein
MNTENNRRASAGRRESTPRLTSIADAVRTEGLGWVWRRLRYRTPATAPGRAVHALLRRGLGLVLAPLRGLHGLDRMSGNTLYAFYDLQVAPITYDVIWFAAAADLTRRQKGLEWVHFVVVPGMKGGVREERAAYDAAVDEFSRLWRLHNVVVPVLTLVPACGGYALLPSRSVAASLRAAAGDRVYPEYYEPALPVSHHPSELLAAARKGETGIGILRSSPQGLRYVERWTAPRLKGRRLITVTLRDYAFMTARNSNLEAWAAFARRLDAARYLPVFVLDTERTLDPQPSAIEGFEVFREASWNVGLRMALYESSYLNLGVNNGPLFMCALNARARLLLFKMVTPSVPQTTAEFMQQLGFEIGAQLPFATRFQRLVWEEDTLDVIEREFTAMVARIEGAEAEVALPCVE